jgi:hypothetical protein
MRHMPHARGSTAIRALGDNMKIDLSHVPLTNLFAEIAKRIENPKTPTGKKSIPARSAMRRRKRTKYTEKSTDVRASIVRRLLVSSRKTGLGIHDIMRELRTKNHQAVYRILNEMRRKGRARTKGHTKATRYFPR